MIHRENNKEHHLTIFVYIYVFFQPDVSQKLDIPGVKPYTEYIIQIAAMNNQGTGPVAKTVVVTAEGSMFEKKNWPFSLACY